MKRKILKKIWIITMIGLFSFAIIPFCVNATDSDLEVNWFNIMPELEESEIQKIDEKIEKIWSEWWHVWDHYNDEADQLKTSQQVASWIMNWDTIMNYLVFIVQFLSQLGLVVWAVFIMIAWYKYAVSLFQWWKVPSSTVKNAIIGIFIVIFSYAIMKILTSFIWLS